MQVALGDVFRADHVRARRCGRKWITGLANVRDDLVHDLAQLGEHSTSDLGVFRITYYARRNALAVRLMAKRIKNRMRPVHPGEVLREEYLSPLGMSVNALAQALRVPATRLHEIVKERRAITADTALRLARYFGGDAHSWMNLQTTYELRKVALEKGRTIEREVDPRAA